MTELTYAALRQIMYQPSAVWLATENSGDRWLHDQWVMLNVTGHPALLVPEGDLIADELPDGAYKLMADPKQGIQPRDSIPPADLEAWFTGVQGTWVPASPSEWSVAEHPGKAMLWVAQGKPCLLGENTWTAIKRHYPECAVYYLRERNFFKFCYSSINEDLFPFCFAAGIKIPEGQENVADWIAHIHSYALTQLATTPTLEAESTSNEEQADGRAATDGLRRGRPPGSRGLGSPGNRIHLRPARIRLRDRAQDLPQGRRSLVRHEGEGAAVIALDRGAASGEGSMRSGESPVNLHGLVHGNFFCKTCDKQFVNEQELVKHIMDVRKAESPPSLAAALRASLEAAVKRRRPASE